MNLPSIVFLWWAALSPAELKASNFDHDVARRRVLPDGMPSIHRTRSRIVGTKYDEKSQSPAEMRRRAKQLLDHDYPNEMRNNIEELRNFAGHAMMTIADLWERIEELERGSVRRD